MIEDSKDKEGKMGHRAFQGNKGTRATEDSRDLLGYQEEMELLEQKDRRVHLALV